MIFMMNVPTFINNYFNAQSILLQQKEAIKTKRRMFAVILLVLDIVISGFVIMNMKNGMNAGEAEAAGTGGNILYVGGSGPNNYTKIQGAINAAGDGNTIFVYSGICYENIVINKSINLVGESKETTIIDGNNTGDVIDIIVDNVTIEGFTIRNGGNWPYAGVKIYHGNDNSIYNCNISNNNDGIRLHHSSNTSIYNCNISNNSGGIYLDSSNNNSIYNCNISNNWGGIHAWHSNNNSIYNCNISNNNYDGIHAWLFIQQ